MDAYPQTSLEIKQELAVTVRDLLRCRMVDLLDMAEKFGFSIKVGGPRATHVVLNRNNIHFIHHKL